MGKEKEISVLGSNGFNLNSQTFNQEVKKEDLKDTALINIFDAYNKNGDNKLDADELSLFFNDLKSVSKNMDIDTNKDTLTKDDIKDADCKRIFREMLKKHCENDSTLSGASLKDFKEKVAIKNLTLDPYEIKELLKSKGLEKQLNIGDVLNFLDVLDVKIQAQKLKGMGCNDKTKTILNSLQAQNVADVFSQYKAENGESVFKTIASDRWSFGSTREDFVNIAKAQLIKNAQLMGIDTTNFEKQFNAELKKMDMTLIRSYDTKKLDELANNLIKEINARKTNYQKNRNGIVSMMADTDLCRTDEDKYELANLIYQDAVTYTPEKMLKIIQTKTDNPLIKQTISKLIKSKYLEYYPIYVASIIAQESQFRSNDAVFSENGQGIMQLTQNRISDIYNNPFLYDDDYTDELVEEFELEEELYSGILNQDNVELNLFVGNIAIGGIMNTVLRRMKNDSIPKSINMNTPEAFMQMVAMSYNGNDAEKKDPKYNNKKSQVRYVYGRDVLQRFKKYTPEEIQVSRYFEYNPDKKDFVNK